MSEEEGLSEEEKDMKRMEIVQALSELGETKLANQLFKKIEKKITFVSLPDWITHQICETYPKCDIRTMVYCCAPTNPCPYRASVLRKLGLTIGDYVEFKKELADVLDKLLEEKIDGKSKSD